MTAMARVELVPAAPTSIALWCPKCFGRKFVRDRKEWYEQILFWSQPWRCEECGYRFALRSEGWSTTHPGTSFAQLLGWTPMWV